MLRKELQQELEVMTKSELHDLLIATKAVLDGEEAKRFDRYMPILGLDCSPRRRYVSDKIRMMNRVELLKLQELIAAEVDGYWTDSIEPALSSYESKDYKVDVVRVSETELDIRLELGKDMFYVKRIQIKETPENFRYYIDLAVSELQTLVQKGTEGLKATENDWFTKYIITK